MERRGKDWSKNMYESPTDMDNGVGLTVEQGGGLGREGQRGKNQDNCNRITIKKIECFQNTLCI